jgi:hypothetical protein
LLKDVSSGAFPLELILVSVEIIVEYIILERRKQEQGWLRTFSAALQGFSASGTILEVPIPE